MQAIRIRIDHETFYITNGVNEIRVRLEDATEAEANWILGNWLSDDCSNNLLKAFAFFMLRLDVIGE